MPQGGYLDTPRQSPAGLGVIIALHAAALTALFLAKGPEIAPGLKDFPLIWIPQAKDPDPLPPPPKQETKPEQESRIAPVDPVVRGPVDRPSTTTIDPPTVTTDFPPVRIEPSIPLVRTPMLVEATFDPAARGSLQPPYPPAMERLEREGKATVRVLIGPDGRVRAVENVDATDPAFFAATERQALRFWRFKPATRDGVAIESWRTMTVRFEITS